MFEFLLDFSTLQRLKAVVSYMDTSTISARGNDEIVANFVKFVPNLFRFGIRVGGRVVVSDKRQQRDSKILPRVLFSWGKVFRIKELQNALYRM
jgi:hypothetical protein